jgi:hypothetical protein
MKYVLKTAAPQRQAFDLTRELNPQQIAVVEAPPRELLVLAGAGTGKTRTLTYRVARLVAAGCHPERILLVHIHQPRRPRDGLPRRDPARRRYAPLLRRHLPPHR